MPTLRGCFALLAALLGLACVSVPAQAQIVSPEPGLSVGLQPRWTGLFEEENEKTAIGVPTNLSGGPVVPTSAVYAIYWDPLDQYHGSWQRTINEFLNNMGQASGSDDVFMVDTQYTDATGGHAGQAASFRGAYTDTDPYPTPEGCNVHLSMLDEGYLSCLTDGQIRHEIEAFVADHSLPRGMGTIYYLLTPPGVTTCLEAGGLRCSAYSGEANPKTNPSYADSFCSYHSAIDPGPGDEGDPETILYGVVPWIAGGLGADPAELAQTPAWDCQSGAERPATASEEEAETFEETPVQQEPNQSGRSPDGWADSGLPDLIISQIGAEQQDIVTDPLLSSWHDSLGGEVTDECRDFFAPAKGGSYAPEKATEAGTMYNQTFAGGNYFINDSFNLAGAHMTYPGAVCLTGISLLPSFTAPSTVNAGEFVGFDGMESTVTLNWGTAYSEGKANVTFAKYEWNFGDGTSVSGYAPGAPPTNSPATSLCEEPWISPCAASAFHSYAYGGVYDVTLTITDTGGNSASVSKQIVVDGPAPPAPTPPEGSGTTKSTVTSKTSKGSTGEASGAKAPLSRPVATAIVATTSLTAAIEKGLAVRYSVNQQVAGHFEVLLPTKLAKLLKIKGSAAKNLPKGMARQTVIAYALLVTIRRAHGTLSIAIPGPTGRRLRHLRHVTLTLRLVVRNASRTHPKSTLLLTKVKLRG